MTLKGNRLVYSLTIGSEIFIFDSQWHSVFHSMRFSIWALIFAEKLDFNMRIGDTAVRIKASIWYILWDFHFMLCWHPWYDKTNCLQMNNNNWFFAFLFFFAPALELIKRSISSLWAVERVKKILTAWFEISLPSSPWLYKGHCGV